jgi:hypothetical protein
MDTDIKNVQMYLKLSLPREAYSLLDEALKSEPQVVHEIIMKADLADVKSTDRRWWTVLVSLFGIGKGLSERQSGNLPDWFDKWATKNYPKLTEWQICEQTVFGGFENESIFDGTRCVDIEYR